MTKFYLVQVKSGETTREKCPPEVFVHNMGFAVQNVVDRMTEGPQPTVKIIALQGGKEKIEELDRLANTLDSFLKGP